MKTYNTNRLLTIALALTVAALTLAATSCSTIQRSGYYRLNSDSTFRNTRGVYSINARKGQRVYIRMTNDSSKANVKLVK